MKITENCNEFVIMFCIFIHVWPDNLFSFFYFHFMKKFLVSLVLIIILTFQPFFTGTYASDISIVPIEGIHSVNISKNIG